MLLILPLVLSAASLAASQSSFSFAFGLDESPSVVDQTSFSFHKIPSRPTPSVPTDDAVSSQRSIARGTPRKASGSRRGSDPTFSTPAEETTRETSQNQPLPSFSFTGIADFTDLKRLSHTPTTVSKKQRQQQISLKENEIHVGRSPCARGIRGHDCRIHLIKTALACTSGKCHECQTCGSIASADWVSCCRDHFLCCRPLASSCQRCDQPLLTPFCNTAFGKCK